MPLTVYTAMRNYRAAYRVTADLKHKHDKLVAEQREILTAEERKELGFTYGVSE